MKTISEFIAQIAMLVIELAGQCFGPLSIPPGKKAVDAIFGDNGIALTGGCSKRLLRMATRGNEEREILIVVLLLSPECADGELLIEAKRWAEKTYKAAAAINALVAAKTRVFVSRSGHSPAALYRVSAKGAEELLG